MLVCARCESAYSPEGATAPASTRSSAAAVRVGSAQYGHEHVGLLGGWRGLLQRDTRPLDRDVVAPILTRGGTILGSSRTNPFKDADGGAECVRAFADLGLDALIAIGGEDTLGVARRLHAELGLPVVGVPKTIDNDLSGTDFTFGFWTAVQIATDAIDRLHTTAESHDRVIVVEVMGRHAGWIALESGTRRRRPRDPDPRAAGLDRGGLRSASSSARGAGPRLRDRRRQRGRGARRRGRGRRRGRVRTRPAGQGRRGRAAGRAHLGRDRRRGPPGGAGTRPAGRHADRLRPRRWPPASAPRAAEVVAEGGFGRMVALPRQHDHRHPPLGRRERAQDRPRGRSTGRPRRSSPGPERARPDAAGSPQDGIAEGRC